MTGTKKTYLALIAGFSLGVGQSAQAASVGVPLSQARSAVTTSTRGFNFHMNALFRLMTIHTLYQQAQVHGMRPVYDTDGKLVLIEKNNYRVAYEVLKNLAVPALLVVPAVDEIIYAPHYWLRDTVLQKIFGMTYGTAGYNQASIVKRWPMRALIAASFMFNQWYFEQTLSEILSTGCDKLIGVPNNKAAMEQLIARIEAERAAEGENND